MTLHRAPMRTPSRRSRDFPAVSVHVAAETTVTGHDMPHDAAREGHEPIRPVDERPPVHDVRSVERGTDGPREPGQVLGGGAVETGRFVTLDDSPVGTMVVAGVEVRKHPYRHSAAQASSLSRGASIPRLDEVPGQSDCSRGSARSARRLSKASCA